MFHVRASGLAAHKCPRPSSLLQRLGPVTKLSFAQKKRTRVICRGELGNKVIQGVGDVQNRKEPNWGT